MAPVVHSAIKKKVRKKYFYLISFKITTFTFTGVVFLTIFSTSSSFSVSNDSFTCAQFQNTSNTIDQKDCYYTFVRQIAANEKSQFCFFEVQFQQLLPVTKFGKTSDLLKTNKSNSKFF